MFSTNLNQISKESKSLHIINANNVPKKFSGHSPLEKLLFFS